MKWIIKRILSEECGQGMVEYGLIIVLIVAVIISSFVVLGPKILSGLFNLELSPGSQT